MTETDPKWPFPTEDANVRFRVAEQSFGCLGQLDS